MSTLVVIDVQEQFLNGVSHPRYIEQKKTVLTAIRKTVEEFVELRKPIIYVEYVAQGHTLPEIIDVEYTLNHFVSKNINDGSEKIMDKINELQLPDDLLICGLYGEWCVKATIEGLKKKIKPEKIKVLGDGIYFNYYADPPEEFTKRLQGTFDSYGVDIINRKQEPSLV